MSRPITRYVLKVHSRCDLACDHCYIYEHADQSWRTKPAAISLRTVGAAAGRVAEHAARYRLPAVHVVLHGGEPLLLGNVAMRRVLDALVAQICPATSLELRIHTNGVQLTESWCDLFADYGVKVGISLDGNQVANDRHRRFLNGRSSYHQVRNALSLLRQDRYRHLYAGILCTIDLQNDPIAVYESLIAEDPPNLDLLFPHATWDRPPPSAAGVETPYASWLSRIYERWTLDGRPVPIRLFDSLIAAAWGAPSQTETVGIEPVDLVVIDTDGSWEQPDSLKTAYDGAPATGLTVFSHSVDKLISQPGFRTRLGGLASLCATCRKCDIATICGGGLYAHRYRAGNGFDNPTVYCEDMKRLVTQLNIRPVSSRQAAPVHRLSPEAFDSLAAGPGSTDAIDALVAMRLSLTRALVATVAASDVAWRDESLQEATQEGWAQLCALELEHPDEVAHVLSHPYVQVWAEQCLEAADESCQELDRAYLANLAVAVACRAGVRRQIMAPVRNGRIFAPTIGALKIRTTTARCVPVWTGAGRFALERGHAVWEPARIIATGIWRLVLEDLDPFRDCQEWPAAPRCSAGQWLTWSVGLSEAGSRLSADIPSYAGGLGTCLRAIVPLRQAASQDRSATARQAFGAVAIAPSRRPHGIDALLVHEFQHVKLNALLDMHDLFDVTDTRRIQVPWRPDPRPVEGVLHGIYAYLAMMQLDQAQCKRERQDYLRLRSWVAETADDLLKTDVLTSDGERFVAGMYRAAVDRL